MITSFFEVFAKYFLLFAIFFDSAVAWFVLSRGWKRPVNQAYFFMVLCITLWQIGNYALSYLPISVEYIYAFIMQINFTSGAMIVGAMFYLALIFLKQKHNFRYMFLVFLVVIIIAIANSLEWTFKIVDFQSNIAGLRFGFNWFFPAYYFYISIILLAIVVISLRNYLEKDIESSQKIKAQYFLIAILIPIFFSGITNIVLPVADFISGNFIHSAYPIHNIGPASTSIMSFLIAYAILHHRLMDIKTVIRRNSLAAAAHIVSIGTIIFIVWLINKGFGQLLNTLQLLIVLFITGSVLILTRPLYRLVNKIIKREYLHLYHYNDMEKIILERTANPQDFSHCAAAHFLRRLPVNPFYVLIYDVKEVCFRVMFPDYTNTSRVYGCNERWLNFFHQNREIYFVEKNEPAHNKDVNEIAAKLHAQCFIPLIPYKQLLGVVVVGKRVDLKPLTKKDKSFMEEFQKSIGLTLVDVLQLHHIVLTHLDDPEAIERVKPMLSKLKR